MTAVDLTRNGFIQQTSKTDAGISPARSHPTTTKGRKRKKQTFIIPLAPPVPLIDGSGTSFQSLHLDCPSTWTDLGAFDVDRLGDHRFARADGLTTRSVFCRAKAVFHTPLTELFDSEFDGPSAYP